MKIAIGVMPEPLLRKRMIAIAQGKYQPAEDEPKVWYTSLNAVSQVLNTETAASRGSDQPCFEPVKKLKY